MYTPDSSNYLYYNVFSLTFNDDSTYIYAYIHTYIRTYKHTDIQTCRNTHIHTYIPTYIHSITNVHTQTHIHTNTHTHINPNTYIHLLIIYDRLLPHVIHTLLQSTQEHL